MDNKSTKTAKLKHDIYSIPLEKFNLYLYNKGCPKYLSSDEFDDVSNFIIETLDKQSCRVLDAGANFYYIVNDGWHSNDEFEICGQKNFESHHLENIKYNSNDPVIFWENYTGRCTLPSYNVDGKSFVSKSFSGNYYISSSSGKYRIGLILEEVNGDVAQPNWIGPCSKSVAKKIIECEIDENKAQKPDYHFVIPYMYVGDDICFALIVTKSEIESDVRAPYWMK